MSTLERVARNQVIVSPDHAWNRAPYLDPDAIRAAGATGATGATIEARRMEASITAPVAGTVERLALPGTRTSTAATSSSCSPMSDKHEGECTG